MAEEIEHNLTVKQQRFLLALLASPTVKAACRKAGITEPTGHKYLHHDEVFATAYTKARRRVNNESLVQLARGRVEAVVALRGVLRRAVRSKDDRAITAAANNLLSHVAPLDRSDEVDSRLDALEAMLAEEKK
jgi:hypothetical protein